MATHEVTFILAAIEPAQAERFELRVYADRKHRDPTGVDNEFVPQGANEKNERCAHLLCNFSRLNESALGRLTLRCGIIEENRENYRRS